MKSLFFTILITTFIVTSAYAHDAMYLHDHNTALNCEVVQNKECSLPNGTVYDGSCYDSCVCVNGLEFCRPI